MSAVILAAALFCLGLYGVLTRREIVAVLAAVEVMLGGATLLLVVLATSFVPDSLADGAASVPAVASSGQAVALMLLAVVAAEAAVGLALLVTLVRRGRARMTEIREVRG